MFHKKTKPNDIMKKQDGRLKGMNLILLAMLLCVNSIGLVGCDGDKKNDTPATSDQKGGSKTDTADNVKAKVEKAFKADTKYANVTVELKGTHIILKGKVKSDADKLEAGKLAEANIEGTIPKTTIDNHILSGATGSPISIQIINSNVNGGFANFNVQTTVDWTKMCSIDDGAIGGILITIRDTTGKIISGPCFTTTIAPVPPLTQTTVRSCFSVSTKAVAYTAAASVVTAQLTMNGNTIAIKSLCENDAPPPKSFSVPSVVSPPLAPPKH